MNIRELIEKFEIQGNYKIKAWNDDIEDYVTLADGVDFEYEYHEIKEEYLERKITYMYAIGGVLIIEVEDK